MDERATIVSVDGLGAFDLVSRKAMLQGPKLFPFVRTFYGQPSVFLWEDEVGDVHQIHQGEGGEQGDPLMPLLFSFAQHPPSCLLSTTISTRCAFPSELANSTVSSPMSWLPNRTLFCTMARPRCGIEEGMPPPCTALQAGKVVGRRRHCLARQRRPAQ